MTGKFFVDTNVLVYAYDRSEPVKQALAVELMNDLVASRAAVISTQVLSEFFNAITRRIAVPLTVDQAHERVKNILMAWPVVDVTGLMVLEATRGVCEHRMSLWDAQIWAAAKLNQITIILSEDFGPQIIEGIRVVNPFAQDFYLADWL